MNDLPSDDELRDALRPGPMPPRPAFDDVRRRARRAQRSRLALAGSGLAVVLLAAGAVGWVAASDDPDETDVVTGGDGSTTTTAPTTTSGTESTTTTAASPFVPGPAGPRPTTALVVTTEGDLRTIDVTSGDTLTELGRYEPSHDPEVGISYLLDDVALTPDGATAFVSRCCEPAGGWMVRLPTDGSMTLDAYDTTEQFFGHVWLVRPAPSTPDLVLSSHYPGMSITTTTPTMRPDEFSDPDYPWPGEAIGVEGVAWSPDERHLAWTEFDGRSIVIGEVVDDTEIRFLARYEFPGGVRWRQPTFRRDGMVVFAESQTEQPQQPDRARVLDPANGALVDEFPLDGAVTSLGYDPTGTWLLVVYEDGRLVGIGGGERFTIASDISRADW